MNRIDRAPPINVPARREGPGARSLRRAEITGAEIVRGYARSLIGMIAEEVDRVPPGSDNQERRIRRALRRARQRMRAEWPARAISEILDALLEEGRKGGRAAARASVRMSRGDASPRVMRERAELPGPEALEIADDVVLRMRLRGTGFGRRALRDLQRRAVEWVRPEVETAATADEMRVGFDRAIGKILGRADLIGSEEANAAAAQAVRAALAKTTTGFYRWRTQQDDRVRDEHREREAKIFTWEDGTGEVGDEHPGDAVNCRCWAEPVTLSELEAGGLIPRE